VPLYTRLIERYLHATLFAIYRVI